MSVGGAAPPWARGHDACLCMDDMDDDGMNGFSVETKRSGGGQEKVESKNDDKGLATKLSGSINQVYQSMHLHDLLV